MFLQDINPLLVANMPLLLAGYALGANSFSYLIFRGIDLVSKKIFNSYSKTVKTSVFKY